MGSSPESAISVLKKLQEDDSLLSPFFNKTTKFIHFIIPEKVRNLFSTHPTNQARIERIEKAYNLGNQNGNDQPGLVRA